MAFDFPNAPGAGQTVTGPQGQTYQWDGTKWASYGAGTAYAPLNAPVFTGDARAVTPAYGDNDTSIPTTAFVQSAVAPVANNTGRNLVMNGAFAVQQRGQGPWTVNFNYTADRWCMSPFGGDALSVSVVAASDADRAGIGDEAARFLLQGVFTGNAAAAAGSFLYQPIEGVRRLSSKTVTISFWAKASAALKLGASLSQSFGNGGSPSAGVNINGQSVALATTWTRYNVTLNLPSVAGKTFGTSGDDATLLYLWFSSGANNNAFAGGVGVQSGTIQLYGIQLEIGSVATPFEAKSYADTLRDCQRFYCVAALYGQANLPAATSAYGISVMLPAQMRATPTAGVLSAANSNLTNFTLPLVTNSMISYNGQVVTGGGQCTINVTIGCSADL